MQPEHGARFTLRLSRTDPDVCYCLEVELPEAVLHGVASVSLDAGVVSLQCERELPTWLSTTVTGLLRSLWRTRRSAPAEPWPRRLTRWRRPEGASA